jgi:MIP family channel proteins
MPTDRLRSLVAEFIGTFALTFVGVLALGSPAIAGMTGAPVDLAIAAFAHGLILAVMVAALGAISGGHFNPGVTFGFMVTGRMDPITGLLYWAAQLVGAIVASYLILSMAGLATVEAGTPQVAENVGTGMAVVLEAVTTFFLVLVVFGTAVDERAPKSVFPLAIGLTLAACIMAIGPLTGGALNPARAFGPALAAGEWSRHIVYWIGPLVGGALGGAVQHFLLMRAPSPQVAEHGGPAPSEKRR